MTTHRERAGVDETGASKYSQQDDRSGRNRVTNWLLHPATTTDMIMTGKAVVAATAAWVLSVGVLDSDVAFMAPWTALLTVHATVHRSLSRGAQTIASSAIGMGLAFVIMEFLGLNVWTFALALLVGLFGSRMSWIRDEGVAIATTAIFIFTAADPLFVDRFIELLLGVALGAGVNLLIVPPLRDEQASRYVDSLHRQIGAVLVDIAQEYRESWDTDRAESWSREIDSMADEVNSAWQAVRMARESQRKNPRAILRWRKSSTPVKLSYEDILQRVNESISHLRNLTRTLLLGTGEVSQRDDEFREGWVDIVHDIGTALADPDHRMQTQLEDLDVLTAKMSHAEDLSSVEWPLYGALLTDLRHLTLIVDEVASAQQARQNVGRTTN